MITRIDRNRLHAEKEILLDDLAEQSRLANLTPKAVESVRNLIYEKHDECLDVLRDEPDVDIEDVLKAYRGLIWKVLKKI